MWYLSRAAGAPCPFARAGIRLCDYSENGKLAISSTRDNNSADEHDGAVRMMRGQKRKRADRSSRRSSNEDQRPFKVKLTLRLPASSPLLFPHYASISPISVASTDVTGIHESLTDSQVDFMSDFSTLSRSDATNMTPCSSPARPVLRLSYPRSPSPFAPLGISSNSCPSPPVSSNFDSPPPDSEDEDDDYHVSMTSFRHYMSDSSDFDMEWDDVDSDADGDALRESPRLKSPSAPLGAIECKIRQEPHDVQGMLDAWEDLDNSIADVKVIEVLTRAATGILPSHESDSDRHFENYLSRDEWQYSHFEESRSRDEDFEICERECLLALCDEIGRAHV